MNQIPPVGQLQHIAQLDEPPANTSTSHTFQPHVAHTSSPVLLGGRIPPIPAKLARRIAEGHYIDMVELRPEYLEELNSADEDHSKTTRPRQKELSSILDWVQAFGIYVAVLSRNHPQRVPSLLAYQHLIIHSHTHFTDFNWASYDRQFRQKASACPGIDWATMDGTLWNLCRTDQAPPRSNRAPLPHYNNTRICLEWNDYITGCSRRNCRYDHICYRCVNLPSYVDCHHRAVSCPNKGKEPQLNTSRPNAPRQVPHKYP